jgi:hypothetical protein
MLAEIEERLVGILQKGVAEIPAENILVDDKPKKFPAIVIRNLDFRFENAALVEDLDQGGTETQEEFSGDGKKRSFKLEETPAKGSVQVEFPTGSFLREKDDFTVNYKEGAVELGTAPSKGKNNVIVKYAPGHRALMLKSLKLKASYSIGVLGKDRVEVDSFAERVVKALLMAQDDLSAEGIEIKPLEGMISVEEDGVRKVQLKYAIERELRVEKVMGPMEKIEIASKKL